MYYILKKIITFLYSLLRSWPVKYNPSLSPHPTVSNCLCLFLTLFAFTIILSVICRLLIISFILSRHCFSELLLEASDLYLNCSPGHLYPHHFETSHHYLFLALLSLRHCSLHLWLPLSGCTPFLSTSS